MSGALVNLVAKGVQDAELTGDPQVSFFRGVYQRHTNFAMQPACLDYIGTWAANNEISIKIPSKGDLLSYMWIESPHINYVGATSEPASSASLVRPGKESAEFRLLIGGQPVDVQDALFQSLVWPNAGYANSQPKAAKSATWEGGASDTDYNWFPLHFFFCDVFKNALPLIALQYHEVEIRIKLPDGYNPGTGGQPKVYANYIYLDTDERDWFVSNPHRMLIPQVQRIPLGSRTDTSVDLSYFNHPVQAIHIADTFDIGQESRVIGGKFLPGNSTLYINGTPLIENVSNVYTHDVVPYYHGQNIVPRMVNHNSLFTYPFATQFSWQQPYGSLNFSRIDNATLRFDSLNDNDNGDANEPVYIYGVNWNILQIREGLSGLAFGN